MDLPLPVAHGGHPPALTIEGHAAHQHTEQPGGLEETSLRFTQLQQQTAALKRGLAWGMKGQIQCFLEPVARLYRPSRG